MAVNNYDLDYTGSMVDRILDTGYDLQNQGYIFRGLASHYTGTPTERTWLIAPTGSTGFGLSSPVPPGSIGICMYNGSSWSAELLNTLTLDTAPTTGSGNGITSGAVKTLAESITNAIGRLEQSVSDRFTSLTLEDTTGSLQAELLSITLKYVFEGETESLTSISILAATAEKAGLMSATDKQKLDAFVTNIRSLRIQDTTAQDDQGTEITNTLKWTIGGVTEAITAFTLYAATTSKAGLMSAADKTALDTLPSLINAGYLYAGIATPSTVPSSTDAKIFYIAVEGGTYTNFGNLNVTQGINIIYKSGNLWSVVQAIGIDDEPMSESENLVKSGGVYGNLYPKVRVNVQEVTSFTESSEMVDETYKTGTFVYGQKINENPYYQDSSVNVLYENDTVRAIRYCFLEVTTIGLPASYRTVALFGANDNLIYESSHTGKILVEVPRGCKLLARTTAIHPFNSYDGGLGGFNVTEVFNMSLKTRMFDIKQISNGIAKFYKESTLTGTWRIMDGINATPVRGNNKYFKHKNEGNNAITILFKTNIEYGLPQSYRTLAIYDGGDKLVYTSYMQGMFSVTLPGGYTIIASADSYMYSTGSPGAWVESLDRIEKEWYDLKNTIISWGSTKSITSSSTYGTIIVNVPIGAKEFMFNGIDYTENTGYILLMGSFPGSNVVNSSVIKTLGATSGKFYDLPEGVRYISIPYGISNNPNIDELFSLSFRVNTVKCIGDSLTQSVVDGIAGRWETYLQELYNSNFFFINYGAGGENVGTIFARTGLLPMQVASDVVIPAISQEVNITIKNVYNQVLLPFMQGELRNGAQVIINGVQGLMKGTMTGIHTADYTFQRNTDGDAVTLKEGDYIFVVNTERARKGDDYAILWVGQNGGYSVNETSRYQGDPTSEADVNRLVGMIKSAITVMNPKKYIVVSPPQNTADLLESSFMMAFGGSYFNVRQYLVNRGIDIAKQNGWLDSSYPKAQDITDMANGIVPTSLRQDEVHFNLTGYKVFAIGIKEMMDLQWVV